MKLIELFSGIGGFTKGLQDAGFEIEEHYFSEIDKHAIANYKYNFPHAKYIGDVKSIQSGDFTGIDIITFGSPCQDFSLAGKRKGLEGSRSSLIQCAIDLVTDVRPSVFIWENVKGAFSSNSGADFWAILQAFANIGGYRLEWQLLNTKWVLPQNRERIYLVGHLDGRSKPGVFPFTEDNFRFNERAIEARNIRTLTAGGNSGGLHSSMTLIKVNSATSSVFEIATERDSINFSNPKSKTRRGHVGKGVAQTLDCGCNQGVMIGAIRGRNPENPKSMESGSSTEQMLEINENWCSNTLTSVQKDNVVVGTWRTHKDGKGLRQTSDGSCPTIPARAREDGSGQPVINNGLSIRRLTEIECELLQGFPQNWTKYGDYDGKIKTVPKTQRYKQCGNAVTATIVMQIGLRLIKLMI
ncbi:DNA (cytosine-5-)-methyltransferase [Elizabethkingia anophelis]|nr:DNA (cytosine-5-)-methyltransferase [Elizabethkingia anophelis]